MRHVKKALSYSVAGGIGLSVIASLNGCSDQGPQPPSMAGFDSASDSAVEQNVFLVVEQTGTAPDTYRLVEKHPTTGPTRAILRMPDGTEQFLSEDELKQITETEAARVAEGTSRLTEDPAMHAGGLSLGEVLIAAAAGSLIGGVLANSLMNNANFQRTQQTYGGGRPVATISQPAQRQASSGKQPRSGFFGNSSGRSGSSSLGGFGG